MHCVIIGSSAAGINAIEAIRSRDKKATITVVSDEIKPLYSRCLISYLLAGTITQDKIWYRQDNFFKDLSVNAILGVKAEKIDTVKKQVLLENNERVDFDKLLIATGAQAKIEDIPGADRKGIYPLRTIKHSLDIEAMLDRVKKVAVLGGGLIGLRAAYALKNRGKDVTLFVRSPQILSQIADEISASIIQKRLEEKGIKIATGRYTKKIIGNGYVKAVALDNGDEYTCELVIVGKGVSPNISIAKEAGIKTNLGIITNGRLMTDNKDIFSAGDAAEVYDIALGEYSLNAIWPCACEQGKIAGLNMSGENAVYDGSLAMNSLEFFGLPIISIGITKSKKDLYTEIIQRDKENNVYKKVVLKDNYIVGALFVNSIDTIGIIGTLIKNKVDISSIKDIILEDYFDYGRIVRLIKDAKQGFKQNEFKETVMTL